MPWTTSRKDRRRMTVCLALTFFLLLIAIYANSSDTFSQKRAGAGLLTYGGADTKIYLDRQLLHDLKKKQDTKVVFSDAMTLNEARSFQYEFYAMHPEVTLCYEPLFSLQAYDESKNICAGYLATYISAAGGNQRYRNLEDASRQFLRGTKTLSDREKVRVISGRLRNNCDYAYTPTDFWGESLYGCLVDGKATCIGYAEGFFYLMKRAGVPCRIEVSKYHAWNKVFYDGKWHKTDLTKD